jgi:hypothetical protein
MGGQVPNSIKKKVKQEWLQGFSRDMIASKNKIGAGTVSKIITETRSKILDLDLMRELALQMKNKGFDLNSLVSTFRLQKMLGRLGLDEVGLEKLLQEISVHCFMAKIDNGEFIHIVEENFKMANSLEISLDEIPSRINQMKFEIILLNKKIKKKQTEKINLDREIEKKQTEKIYAIEDYNLTLMDLEDYRATRPLLDKIKKQNKEIIRLEKIIRLQNKTIKGYQAELYMEKYSNSVLEKELEKANEEIEKFPDEDLLIFKN